MNVQVTQVGRSKIIHPATLNPVAHGRQFRIISIQNTQQGWMYSVRNDRGEDKDMTEIEYYNFFNV